MSEHKKKLAFALFFICFIMPVFIFYSGMSYYRYLRLELKKSNLLTLAGSLSSKIAPYTNNRSYWCHQLNRIIKTSYSKEQAAQRFKEKLKQNRQKANWIVWGPDWRSIKNSGFNKVAKLDLDYTGRTIRKAISSKGRRLNYSEKVYLKKLIGPHIFFARTATMDKNNYPNFLATNFKNKAPLFWGNYTTTLTAFMLFPAEVASKKQCFEDLINQFKEQNPEQEIFLLKNKNIYTNSNKISSSRIHSIKKRFNTSEKSILIDKNRVFYGEQLINDTFLIVADTTGIETNSTDKSTMLFILIWAFFNLLFFQSFSVLNTMSNLKVRWAIYGFIGLSNILPLIMLAVFTSQYMNQKYLAMIDNKKIQAVNFLQRIEEEYLNEIERFPHGAKQIVKQNKSLFDKSQFSLRDARHLKSVFKIKNLDFNIIANNAKTFINNEVLVTKNNIVNLNDDREIKKTKKFVDVMNKLGKCYLAFLNNSPLSQKDLTELELLSDMVFQKTIEESLHYFVELSDQVINFGVGTSSLPSFAYLVKKTNSKIFNYICVFQLPLEDSAIRYLEKIKTSRLANPFGLKVIFQQDAKLRKPHLFPFKKTRKLGQLMAKLKIYPPAKATRVTLDGKKWIYTGYKSSIMHAIQLAAFYPVAEINHKLKQEKRDLIILFVANLFIVLVISYFFSKTLLIPIHHLKEGTEAINTRNFAYRLPDLGQDEFGKMAEIFNTAISDLEELSVAGVVQQNLFPTGKIPTGNFELFGKSEALADLGGDYLDYFDIDEENFAVILGDVAGHGVGAALLMAIAKSTTINSADYYKKPVEFTSRLHQLIYKSKTRKQKKIMTFQYLLVNKNSNSLTFCNAGGCNPFVVNGPQNKVEEIQLPAPALGAFKRAKYKDRQLSFTSGDVMVLYTDGIVEARNKDNEEIGYELFKEILLRNYTTNPEQYYQKVLKEYHDWLGETDAEDDLTMIFLTMERIKPSAIKPGLK